MTKALFVAAACWAILTLAPGSAMASGPEDTANDIAGKVTSPFCPGVTLHDCPSRAAADLRDRISAWAEAGWSRDRIMTRLVAEYGPEIRAVPPASGTGLIAWVLPLVALAIGAGVAFAALRNWTADNHRAGAGKRAGADSLSLSVAERRRLDDELAAFRGR